MDNFVSFLVDETSKNTLAYVSYLLALNPDIQKKLQSEIANFFEENPVRYICFVASLRAFLLFRKPHFMKQHKRLTT